jgi:hypothetical protein
MLVGLLGANIQGSMSPALFADAFAAAGIDGYYHLLDADRLPGRLPQLFDAIKTAGFIGANVTFPFKQEIIPLLDAVDPGAAQVGAVNTVVFAPDGRSTGYNFDRAGWRNSFDERIGSDGAKDATVVQIGAGGAGRAVAFALMDLGVADLVLHDLDRARANALQADLSRHYGPSRLSRQSGSGRSAQSRPLGRRRHLHADANRIPQSRRRKRRPHAQRQRHVRASGGRGVCATHRRRARSGAAASRLRRCRRGPRRSAPCSDLGHMSRTLIT